MSVSLRHIILLIGTLAVFLSFLFFSGGTETYDLLFISGFLIATISYLVILFKKDTLKNKIYWTLVVIALCVIQQLTEPLLIKKSYSIFIIHNQGRLENLNDLILTKKDGLLFMPTLDTNVSRDFTATEIKYIYSLVTGTNISLIEKDSDKIFYRTYGMLDVQNGIFYFYGAAKPDKRFKHIYGKWFY